MRGWKVWVAESANRWRVRWKGKYGTGQATFLYKADAKDHADDKRREFQLTDVGRSPPQKPSSITVGKFSAEYLTYSKAEKSPRTYRNFDVPAVASIRSYLGDGMLLTAVQPSQVQAWKHSLGEGTTASMMFRAVGTFFNYAVRMRYLTESPAKGLKKPQESGGGRALTDGEIIGLLSNAEEALLRTGTFSLNTLLRIGEICALRWEWTWREDGELVGRIPGEIRKTRKECTFPINAAAENAMGPPQREGRVFPWSPTTIQHQLIRARTKANLPDDVTFHCLRHTGATHYLDDERPDGGHMEDLLKNGLWKDPRSLLRYAHPRLKTLIRRFKALKYPDFAPIRLLPKEDGPLS